MSENTIQFIGCLALGATVFFALFCARELMLLIKNRREMRAYEAGEAEREHKAERYEARVRANVAREKREAAAEKQAQTKPKTAAVVKAAPVRKPAQPKPVTAPVKKIPAAPVQTARAQTAKKWDPFSDFL